MKYRNPHSHVPQQKSKILKISGGGGRDYNMKKVKIFNEFKKFLE